jgi:regulatory protein spx
MKSRAKEMNNMIKLYISPSCSSCRKVKEWFTEQKIPFSVKNILSGELSDQDIKEILTKSIDGTDEIISNRSNVIKDNKVDLGEMSLNQLIAFIKQNPSCLKRPIIVDDSKIQVGYNSEEIRAFIPEARRIFAKNCSPESCPNYATCPDRLSGEGEKVRKTSRA